AIALQTINAGALVERTGDGSDAPVTPSDQMLDRHAGTSDVVHVDIGERTVCARTATEHDGSAAPVEPFRQRIVSVQRDHQHAVDVTRGQIALEPGFVLG